MPYIKKENRRKLDATINILVNQIRDLVKEDDITASDGDLNYTITRLLTGVFGLAGAPKYHKFNSVVGVLECVKLEMYRRQVAPYEDQKIIDNGDVI